jgi:hypothetical protein
VFDGTYIHILERPVVKIGASKDRIVSCLKMREENIIARFDVLTGKSPRGNKTKKNVGLNYLSQARDVKCRPP